MKTKCKSCFCNYAVEPPDGNWGWMIAVAVFLLGYFTWGVFIAYPIFYQPLMNKFRISLGDVTWITGAHEIGRAFGRKYKYFSNAFYVAFTFRVLLLLFYLFLKVLFILFILVLFISKAGVGNLLNPEIDLKTRWLPAIDLSSAKHKVSPVQCTMLGNSNV